ncbi:MAG: hypothetical protein GXY37_03450 [Chloroflexi bacterium]|nr:hypothetical protein [Chloroflexota bacterium]
MNATLNDWPTSRFFLAGSLKSQSSASMWVVLEAKGFCRITPNLLDTPPVGLDNYTNLPEQPNIYS